MKKSKLLILGLIALMLVGGLALASCGEKCPNDKKCSTDSRCGEANGITGVCAVAFDSSKKCNCP